jgi:hypothetical protein
MIPPLAGIVDGATRASPRPPEPLMIVVAGG